VSDDLNSAKTKRSPALDACQLTCTPREPVCDSLSRLTAQVCLDRAGMPHRGSTCLQPVVGMQSLVLCDLSSALPPASGLANIRDARLLDGAIDLDSHPGKCTAATLRFPAASASMKARPAGTPP